MRSLVFAVLCFLVVLAGAARAQDVPDAAIPPALRDWRGWVLKDAEFRRCPFLAGQMPGEAAAHRCAWPARLELDATADGASFRQRWQVELAQWLPLPGDAEYWPQEVSVDGKPAVVLPHAGMPSLWATPGSVEIRGRIPWAHRPQQLKLPEEIGLVALRVDGKAVEPVERGDGALTLGRGEASEPEADALDLRVFRRLADGIPATLETRLQLDVAGQAREETLAPVLPEGFVPLALDGELPARLDPDGKLHVQVQPGSFTLTLQARASAPLDTLAARLGEAPWPAQEIWSYAADPGLRVTTATSAHSIDPAQAGVPEDWRALPAFALENGATLRVEERSRGLAGDEANRLNLVREAWLDFDGDGLYAKDQIGGRMQRGWRLDVAPPYRLQRAEADGQGLLVTRGAAAGESGVELRNPQTNLQAGLRIDAAGGRLPITGWKQAFDGVTLTLHLPFGYRLLGAPGADRADGSWVSRWNLLHLFAVAIAGLLAWRVFGAAGGAMALIYLVLGYHEPGAPRWVLVGVLALALLWRALPVGKLQSVAWGLACIALLGLVLLTLPFLADQVRYALYPQLESGPAYAVAAYSQGFPGEAEEAMSMAEPKDMPAMAPPPPPASPMVEGGAYRQNAPVPKPMPAQAQEKQQAGLDTIVVTGSRVDRAHIETSSPVVSLPLNAIAGAGKLKSGGDAITQRYASNTVIQAGKGEPGWQFGSSYRLSWSGPVLAGQSVRLLIAPPWLTRLLRVAMLAMLLLTTAQLARRLFAARPATLDRARAAALLLAACVAMPQAATVRAADFPDDDLLTALRERLLRAPECAPDCANAARADVQVAGDSVRVGLVLATGERVGVPLPGADGNLVLDDVRVDGAAAPGLARDKDQLWIALARGVHRVELSFRAVDSDHVALKFPLRPAYVAVAGAGWQAAGLSEQRLLGDTLTLTRERREDAAGAATPVRAAQQFPAYVLLQRQLALDVDWSLTNDATRLAPAHGGFATQVPLLAKEQVLSTATKTENGKVLLSFDADQAQVEWNSRLERSDAIALTAPPLGERAEIWRIVASPMWHVEFKGVPEVATVNAAGYWTHEFHPLPGETLTVTVTRPEAVEGQSVAIDRVGIAASAGARAVDTTLRLSVRSTQGGEHAIVLPAGAEVLGVSKNGQPLNLRAREGRLSLPLTPGAQAFELRLREAREMGLRAQAPQFGLGLAAANVDLALQLPADRWVLAAFGPPVGPAVLYWGELVVMILVAWALARLRRTPLRLHHWLLLGIGFSTFSWVALILVVVWLFVLDARQRWISPRHEGVFNLAQVGIVVLTVLALFCLVASIPYGLLGRPDMHIAGVGSSASVLHWFADQTADLTPAASALSLPLWAYKLAMLAWALWLANALIGWLRWAFAAWSEGGYWRNAPRTPAVSAPAAGASDTSVSTDRTDG